MGRGAGQERAEEGIDDRGNAVDAEEWIISSQLSWHLYYLTSPGLQTRRRMSDTLVSRYVSLQFGGFLAALTGPSKRARGSGSLYRACGSVVHARTD